MHIVIVGVMGMPDFHSFGYDFYVSGIPRGAGVFHVAGAVGDKEGDHDDKSDDDQDGNERKHEVKAARGPEAAASERGRSKSGIHLFTSFLIGLATSDQDSELTPCFFNARTDRLVSKDFVFSGNTYE
ncbi:hypothetical protein D1872_263460 [compost metagenome]